MRPMRLRLGQVSTARTRNLIPHRLNQIRMHGSCLRFRRTWHSRRGKKDVAMMRTKDTIRQELVIAQARFSELERAREEASSS